MARSNLSSNGQSLPAQWQQLKAQALTQWEAMGERERIALGTVGALLVLLLAWSLLLAPALRVLKSAPAELEKLDAQAQAALTASVEHLGPAARLNLTGDRAVVTLTGIAPEALQAWLGEVRSAARARPVEAQLTRGPKGYAGTLVLTLGGS
jgi:general secretion pathway protein M